MNNETMIFDVTNICENRGGAKITLLIHIPKRKAMKKTTTVENIIKVFF